LILTLPRETQFPKLRLIRLSGETLYAKDIKRGQEHFSSECIFVNALGATEAPNTLEYFIDQETRITDTIVPCGYATEDTDVALLDKNGEEVGSGQIGEIAIKSRYLSPGYWRKPDLTQAKFLRDSTAGDEQLYLTGDIGRMLPDGCLVHLGRKDF